MNEYDALVENTGDQRNEYDDLLNEQRDLARKDVRSSLFGAMQTSPDDFAKAKKLERAVGIPAPVVQSNLKEVEQRNTVNEYEAFLVEHPKLAEHYARPDFAKLAIDDKDNLGPIEKGIRFLGNLGTNSLAGIRSFNEGAWGFTSMIADLFGENLLGQKNALSNPVSKFAWGMAKNEAARAQQLREYNQPQSTMESWERSIYSGMESLGSNLLTMPWMLSTAPAQVGTMVTQGLSRGQILWNMAKPMLPMGVQTTGQEFVKGKDKGLDTNTAARYAATQGLTEVATEWIPVFKFLEDVGAGTPFLKMLAKQIVAENIGEQVATVAQDWTEWRYLHPEKTIDDYIAERPSAALDTLISTMVTVTGQTSVVRSADRLSQSFGERRIRAQQAQQQAQQLQRIMEAAKGSKLRERDPQTFAQFVDSAAESTGADIQDVYVDARTLVEVLNQAGLDETQAALYLPTLKEQLPMALRTGGDIRLSVGELLATLPGTQLETSIIPHVRMSADGLSLAEADVYLQQEAKQLQEMADKALEENAADEGFRTSSDAVFNSVLDQLTQANRFTGDVNQAYAKLVQNFYTTLASRMGTTPEAVFSEYGLSVAAEMPMASDNLRQAGFERGPNLNDSERAVESRFFESIVANEPDLVRQYVERYGTLVDSDAVKTLSPDYVADPSLAAAVHEPSSYMAKAIYKQLLSRRTGQRVLMTAGGGGSGKSETLLRSSKELQPDIVYDSTLSSFKSAKARIDEALAAGAEVRIVYTNREVGAAFEFAMTRPRVVPLVNIAKAHVDAAKTIKDIAAEYANDPRVQIIVVNNNGTLDEIAVGSLDDVPDYAYNDVIRRLYEQAQRSAEEGRIPQERLGPLVRGVDGVGREEIRLGEPGRVDGGTGEGQRSEEASRGVQGETLAQAPVRTSDVGHKREKTSGRYVGAPDWVGSSPQQLVQLRKKLRQLTLEGAAGRFWYENSSRAILEMVGGDKVEAERFVSLIAIYSPNATVPANTSMALTAWYQYKAGLPIDAGFGEADAKAEKLLRQGQPWSGIKTNSFYQNLMVEIDSSKLDEGVATMDMWMALAFDYGSKALDQGPKYKFAEREIAAVADEMGWKAHQVQAAIWTAMKARIDPIRPALKARELKEGIGREITKKDPKTGKDKVMYEVLPARKYDHFRLAHKMGMEASFDVESVMTSKYDFSDALRERLAQISWEATPGATTGQLPEMLNASTQDKMDYLTDVASVLTKDGRDTIAELVGLPPGTTLFGYSAWQGDIGAGAQTLVPVPSQGTQGKRSVKPAARDLLDLYSAARGYVLSQEAVVWHTPVYDDAKVRHNGLELRTARALTEGEMRTLYDAVHREFGTWELAPGYTAQGARILNFVEGLDNKEFQTRIRKVLGNLPDDFGGGEVFASGYRSDGEYIFNDWKESPNGENYRDRIAARRPDVLGALDRLRADVAQVNARWAERLADRQSDELFQGADGTGTTDAAGPNDAVDTPLAQSKGNRGAYSPSKMSITLLQRADLSTFLHETGHHFLEVLAKVSQSPSATPALQADFATLLRWFGVPDAKSWNDMTFEGRQPLHEKFAESFEQYLFEGKSPNPDMQGLFNRFRSWLTNVYKSFQDFLGTYNTGLTDEVRQVMDRMLATEQQIQAAEAARNMVPLFRDAKEAGMTEDEWLAYQELGNEASAAAMNELNKRSLSDMRYASRARSAALKAIQDEVKEKRAAMRAEVEAETKLEPVYQAHLFLTRGEFQQANLTNAQRRLVDSLAGTSAKLDLEILREMYGEGPAAPWRYLPTGKFGLATAKDGAHPDLIAQLFGFSSGDHLVRALLEAPKLQDLVDSRTDVRMLERYGDLTNEQTLARAADEAVHNNVRTRFVATELRALARGLNAREDTGRTDAAGRRVTENVLTRGAKEAMEAAIARRKLRDIRPGEAMAAQSRSARAAEEAVKKGDTASAIVHKRNQLLHMYGSRFSFEALNEVEKGLRYLKQFDGESKRKRVDPDYLDQIDAMLERFDLRKGQSLTAIDKRAKLKDWIAKQEELGLDPVISDELREEANRKHYRDMSLDEFRGLVDAIRNIEHLGKLKKKLLTAKDEREFAQIVDDIVASIETNAKSTKPQNIEETGLQRLKRGIDSFFAMHRKAASLIRQMDGYKEGPFWQVFTRTMNEAANTEARMREEASVSLHELFKQVLKNGPRMSSKMYIPEINTSLSREARLSVALNWGNEQNRQRLRDGFRWTDQQVGAVLATVTQDEWNFVQSVWDYLDTYWTAISEKERRVSGVTPERVVPSPVQTAFGTLRGGYYPIKYNPRLSDIAESHDTAQVAKDMLRGAYVRSTTRRGHTQARAEEVTGRPIDLSFSTITGHLNQVIHDLSWHEWLIDANRIVRNPKVSGAIRQYHGDVVLTELKKLMPDIAAGEVSATNAWEAAVNHLRVGATVTGLGYNVVSALMQPLGFSQSVVRVGPGWMTKGIVSFLGTPAHMSAKVEEIYGKSEMMRLRGKTMQREINEIRNKIDSRLPVAQASFFYMITKMQQVVDVPTWLAAYEKSIASGADEATAVAVADQSVLDSQSGGQIKDLARIQRGSALQKLWTNFYSFFSTTYNLMAEKTGKTNFKNPVEVAVLAVDYMMLTIVPATLGALIRHVLGGDDDDELLKNMLAENVSYLLGLMVGVREVTFGLQKAAGVQKFQSDYAGPAGLRFLQAFDRLGQQVGQGELDGAFWKSLNNVAGILFHYPSGQVNRTVGGAAALIEGDTENPGVLLVGP